MTTQPYVLETSLSITVRELIHADSLEDAYDALNAVEERHIHLAEQVLTNTPAGENHFLLVDADVRPAEYTEVVGEDRLFPNEPMLQACSHHDHYELVDTTFTIGLADDDEDEEEA